MTFRLDFEAADLTQDAYLGGKLALWQPRRGYRAGVDPVLLAAAVPARTGQSVLELGCGVGAAILCLGARVTGLSLTGVELSKAHAALARRNGAGALEVIPADIADLPQGLRQRQFDHVIANPPYFDRDASKPSAEPLREVAHGEALPLETWVRVAAKRLKPGGMVHVIHRTERLDQLIRALPADLGSIEVLPIVSRSGRAPERIILRAKKNGRGAFKLHAPLVMHKGDRHQSDAGEDYTPLARAVLREGAALAF